MDVDSVAVMACAYRSTRADVVRHHDISTVFHLVDQLVQHSFGLQCFLQCCLSLFVFLGFDLTFQFGQMAQFEFKMASAWSSLNLNFDQFRFGLILMSDGNNLINVRCNHQPAGCAAAGDVLNSCCGFRSRWCH